MGNPAVWTTRAMRKRLLCKPRTTRYLIGAYGVRYMDLMPSNAMRGTDHEGRVHYWVPPRKASKPFEKKLGALDLKDIQPVFAEKGGDA